MANTIDANLQNNIISQAALEAFTSILAPLNAFSTSFNDDAGYRGKTITCAKFATTTGVTDFGGTYTAMDTTYDDVQITLDKHKFCTWHVTDTEVSQSTAVELERFGYQKGGELAKAVFQSILSVVTNANYSANEVVTAANFDLDEVADLREAMVDAGVFADQCSLILQNDYFTSLLKDTDLAPAMNYGSAEVIQGGRIPSLFGIKGIYETTSVPLNGEALEGFICHPSAMAVAMRYLEPISSGQYIAARPITDPDSGITMGYREFYSTDTGTQTAVLEAVYGMAVGVPGNLVRLTNV
jgi:hypothetical protein